MDDLFDYMTESVFSHVHFFVGSDDDFMVDRFWLLTGVLVSLRSS